MEAQKQEAEKKAYVKEQRSALMSQVLESEARSRLANIAAIKMTKKALLKNLQLLISI